MIGVYLRSAALAVAIFASYVLAAPAVLRAQDSTLHGAEIHDLTRRANEYGQTLQMVEAREAATEGAVSELEGEDRVFFWVLSVLTGGSLVGQVIQVSNRRK